jgi:hydroxylamine reductase
MFWNQCEETVKGTGCTVWGVCGKEDDIAAYQDRRTVRPQAQYQGAGRQGPHGECITLLFIPDC